MKYSHMAILYFLQNNFPLDLSYINQKLLSFFELDIINRLIIFDIYEPSNILINAQIDCNFEVKILLSIDVAHSIAELSFTNVSLFAKSLSLPFYIKKSILF